MTWFAMAFLLTAATLAQSLCPPVALLGHVKFPWLLSLVLYYAMRRERWTMLVAAVVGGILQDALCHTPIGFSSLLLLVVGIAAAACKGVVMTETAATAAFFGFVLTGLLVFAGGVWLRATGAASVSLAGRFGQALGGALLGGICAPFVCSAVGSLDLAMGNVKRKNNIHGTC